MLVRQKSELIHRSLEKRRALKGSAWVSVVITVLASIALWWLELTDLLAWTPVQIVTNVAFLSIFVCSVMRSLLAGQRTLGDNVTLLLSLPLFLLLGCFLWVSKLIAFGALMRLWIRTLGVPKLAPQMDASSFAALQLTPQDMVMPAHQVWREGLVVKNIKKMAASRRHRLFGGIFENIGLARSELMFDLAVFNQAIVLEFALKSLPMFVEKLFWEARKRPHPLQQTEWDWPTMEQIEWDWPAMDVSFALSAVMLFIYLSSCKTYHSVWVSGSWASHFDDYLEPVIGLHNSLSRTLAPHSTQPADETADSGPQPDRPSSQKKKKPFLMMGKNALASPLRRRSERLKALGENKA